MPELPERDPAVRRRPQPVPHLRHQRLQAHVQGVRRRARKVCNATFGCWQGDAIQPKK